jgi:hypothetical protein
MARFKKSKLVRKTMKSRKLLFFSFINGLNLAYRAHLVYFDFFFVTHKVFQFLQCLLFDNLIQAYFLIKHPVFKNQKGVRVFFRYGAQQRLLFNRLQLVTKTNKLRKKDLLFWIERKASLVFPILFIETSEYGIITDRQLFNLRFTDTITKYTGGRLVAIIKE